MTLIVVHLLHLTIYFHHSIILKQVLWYKKMFGACGLRKVWLECSRGGRWNNVTGETGHIELLPSSAVYWGLCASGSPEYFIFREVTNVSLPSHDRQARSSRPLLHDIYCFTPNLFHVEPNRWNNLRYH